jgi:uncharacterized repeat protein (TIGR03803 family)
MKQIRWQMMAAILTAAAVSVRGDYQVVHEFASSSANGAFPMAAPVSGGGSLYGMTPYGGVSNWGVIYRVTLADSHYVHLHSFTGPDGKYPLGPVLLSGTNLYGMTSRGGSNDAGVIFRVGTNGTGFTVLHHFDADNFNNGAMPWGGLIEDAGVLYGMTYNGGITNRGVVFSIRADGTGYTNLHRFLGGAGDGKHPKGSLLYGGGRLYGMTSEGGAHNAGVVFSMAADGSWYTNLYEFSGENGDGKNPSGSLVADGRWLFGMAGPGRDNAGVAFCISTNGGTMNFMWYFSGSATDGADPYGDFIKHDTKLYGATRFGGSNSAGVVASLGSSYTNQYAWLSGGEPIGGLVAVGDVVYGAALRGGAEGKGALFRLDINTNDGPKAWCAMTWVENGQLADVFAGDMPSDRMWVQHQSAGGLPDAAFVGYGLNPTADDASWTWLPLDAYGLVNGGADYEFTGRFGRASAGQYVVAAKFIKGRHVYYTRGIGDWGDWDTALYATIPWRVMPLTAPSNAYARYVATNYINVQFQGDGTHWVMIFRKTGSNPEFTAPADGTEYYTGDDYPAQGRCVYRGPANLLSDTGLVASTIYQYRLYTENYAFYSTGALASASTDPSRDDDVDGMPNQYEVDESFDPGNAADGTGDADGDAALNWQEYVAGTSPRDSNSVLAITSARRGASESKHVLTWSSVAGKRYTLCAATNLMTGFNRVIGTDILAQPPENGYTNNAAGYDRLYYRVQVQR